MKKRGPRAREVGGRGQDRLGPVGRSRGLDCGSTMGGRHVDASEEGKRNSTIVQARTRSITLQNFLQVVGPALLSPTHGSG